MIAVLVCADPAWGGHDEGWCEPGSARFECQRERHGSSVPLWWMMLALLSIVVVLGRGSIARWKRQAWDDQGQTRTMQSDGVEGLIQAGQADEEWRRQQGGRGAMVEALLDPALNYHEFLDRLMVAQAVSIGATEAAVFRVGDGEEMELKLVGQLRGDETNAEVWG